MHHSAREYGGPSGPWAGERGENKKIFFAFLKNFPTFAVPSETEGKTQEIDSVPSGERLR
ncbi:hypothetical protein C5745_15335 [Sphingobacterium haloxyli]|uniref:Uncharacterized protein n=1 Tax=Sphingobacterium haloxyli TaxID=2100533 RepID=A0A2S9J1A8_9SPHI|nr:hypothetical protein C5745_15335 [Sphingobacterium haloxyli]